jgi:hypothetical protein
MAVGSISDDSGRSKHKDITKNSVKICQNTKILLSLYGVQMMRKMLHCVLNDKKCKELSMKEKKLERNLCNLCKQSIRRCYIL